MKSSRGNRFSNAWPCPHCRDETPDIWKYDVAHFALYTGDGCSSRCATWRRISYRDLAKMMQERGVEIDPSTIMRWVHRCAPELEKHVRWYQGYCATSWRVDETYVKVGGKWKYFFRAVDKHGRLIDFMLADRRNTSAARRFLGKALTIMRHWPPSSITTDQLGSYPKAISRLPREGKLAPNTRHRTCKYLNNIIEADHGALRPRSTQTRSSTNTRLSDHEDCRRHNQRFEVMRMIRRGHCLTFEPYVKDEVQFVNKLFDVFALAA